MVAHLSAELRSGIETTEPTRQKVNIQESESE
jgi:hypothetical protein